ncbi:hypothetical protein [Dactylosporangium sp. CS-033363]|uniref:hypothetical protein n=1 Tax=Dactylosporangium sp. CS-033363 TaxID=3239935 RepID=UPI003D90085E
MSDLSVLQRVSGRRITLARLGAAIVGASAATLMAAKSAEAAPTPRGCYGYPGCDSGCGSTIAGKCCWYWSDDAACRTYACCDRWDLSPSPCICRFYVGHMC